MSMPTKSEIVSTVRNFLTDEFGLDENALALDTNFFESNLLDSMEVLHIIAFVDETYAFSTQIYEVSLENFATLNNLTDYIQKKLTAR